MKEKNEVEDVRPDYVCKAPEVYNGPCFPKQNLSDLTKDERR